MSTFKIGDRVRIIQGYRLGQEGTITHIHNTVLWPYDVEADDKSFMSPRAADELAYATAFDPDPEPAFKVGDPVRTHTEPGSRYDNLTGVIRRPAYHPDYDWAVSVPSPYDKGAPTEAIFTSDELELIVPEPLADWEIEFLIAPGYAGTIYEKVCKERRIIPERGW